MSDLLEEVLVQMVQIGGQLDLVTRILTAVCCKRFFAILHFRENKAKISREVKYQLGALGTSQALKWFFKRKWFPSGKRLDGVLEAAVSHANFALLNAMTLTKIRDLIMQFQFFCHNGHDGPCEVKQLSALNLARFVGESGNSKLRDLITGKHGFTLSASSLCYGACEGGRLDFLEQNIGETTESDCQEFAKIAFLRGHEEVLDFLVRTTSVKLSTIMFDSRSQFIFPEKLLIEISDPKIFDRMLLYSDRAGCKFMHVGGVLKQALHLGCNSVQILDSSFPDLLLHNISSYEIKQLVNNRKFDLAKFVGEKCPASLVQVKSIYEAVFGTKSLHMKKKWITIWKPIGDQQKVSILDFVKFLESMAILPPRDLFLVPENFVKFSNFALPWNRFSWRCWIELLEFFFKHKVSLPVIFLNHLKENASVGNEQAREAIVKITIDFVEFH